MEIEQQARSELDKCLGARLSQAASSKYPTDEDLARRDAEEERRRQASEFRRLVDRRGRRYAQATFETFETPTPVHEAALESVRSYADNLLEHAHNGVNLILFGPRGTGKDHLAFALMRYAIRECRFSIGSVNYGSTGSIVWENGVEIYGRLRDCMNDRHSREREVIAEYSLASLLVISDPIPPAGCLTEFQMGALFRILDARYSNRRPIVTTINVSGPAELDLRMGPQNADRLRDGAIAVHCNWQSYRKARA